MSAAPLNIIGLCGSLRGGSLNRMALALAAQHLPGNSVFNLLDARALPIFDADMVAQGMPRAVVTLAEQIRRADGVIIASPEYNFSIPGGLKNTIDWLSRGEDQPFQRKPVAILSASPGPLGGARVQYDLRRVLLFLNAMVLTKPEVFIGHAVSKFSQEGVCTDNPTDGFVAAQMAAFVEWIAAVKRMYEATR